MLIMHVYEDYSMCDGVNVSGVRLLGFLNVVVRNTGVIRR